MRPSFVPDKPPTTSSLQVTPDNASMHPSFGVRYGIFHLSGHVGFESQVFESSVLWGWDGMGTGRKVTCFGTPRFNRSSLLGSHLKREAPRAVLTQFTE